MILPPNELKIRNFVAKSGIDFRILADALGESVKFVMHWWNQPDSFWLSDRQLNNLAAFLDMTLDQMITSELPIEELRKRFIAGPLAIEERYFKNAFSHARTTAHIVRYLAIRYGRNKVDALLRQMGVHPCLHASLDNKISIDFFIELLDHAKLLGLSKEEVHQLGCYMFLGVSGTKIGAQFASANNYADCFNILDQNFHNFDQNFIYKLTLSDKDFEMVIRPGEMLAKKIKDGDVDCSTLALYRRHMVCWFPYLSNLPPISTRLVKSLAYGDNHCVLRAEFPGYNGPKNFVRPPLVQTV